MIAMTPVRGAGQRAQPGHLPNSNCELQTMPTAGLDMWCNVQVVLLLAYYLLAGSMLQWVVGRPETKRMAWQLPAPQHEQLLAG